MKAVFDTNVLVDYLNGHEEARKELSLYRRRLISIITRIEILVGTAGEAEENTVRSFLSSFECMELTGEISEEAVRIRKRERLKIPDAIVYATARIEGCILVSRNTRDFKPEWPDVRVPYELS